MVCVLSLKACSSLMGHLAAILQVLGHLHNPSKVFRKWWAENNSSSCEVLSFLFEMGSSSDSQLKLDFDNNYLVIRLWGAKSCDMQ